MGSKRFSNKKFIIAATCIAFAVIAVYFWLGREKTVDFSADVKPILNKNCISCHGGVKAKGGFSVLFREEALAVTESGKPAIIPGDPEGSEFIRRIRANDPEERMPYKHAPLAPGEIDILTRWVKQGAKWGDHWAYLPVQKVEAPAENASWVRNDVDRFIYTRLKEEKLQPSAEADKPTLLRRVSLDLIGRYPDANLAKQYLNSNDPNAYHALVDSLLASKHFGEKWASMWLDLARYADTKGYESDHERPIWKYRDWVIKAFNEDKPYDQFLTEQIAGDLLPNATDEDYVATAFNRNTMSNDEGGTDNEEFRIAAVMDRINTTWESIMGTTFACVQCHSHPYDPFRHDEYYKFMAYFNNTRDEDLPTDLPLLRHFNEEQKEEVNRVAEWVENNVSAEESRRVKTFLRTLQPAINSIKIQEIRNSAMEYNFGFMVRNDAQFTLKQVTFNGADLLVMPWSSQHEGGIMTIHLDSLNSPALVRINLPKMNAGVWERLNWKKLFIEIPRVEGVHDVYFTYINHGRPMNSDKSNGSFDWFAFTSFPGKGKPGYEENNRIFRKLVDASTPVTPVMLENPQWLTRTTRVFERGSMRTPGDEVQAAVPAVFQAAMPEDAPKNRMGLAMWLTDNRNPLVSRTIINRLWEQLFGTGIVETLEDMGTQGIPPTHQDMLDHYSYRLMNDLKWSLKGVLKEFVTSATYRQDSKVTPELLEKDQFNRFYARGPRFRLSSEQMRDQHLCVSGLMNEKMYGPGMMPWQPPGIWNTPYNSERWKQSEGEEQYRRAVYIFWKRSAPYPSMISFDAVQRVLCTARRIRTNTPLQALVTLNDSAYFEMSQHFALRMKSEAPASVEEQLSKGYEMMLFKKIPEEKVKVFLDLYNRSLNEYRQDEELAKELTRNLNVKDVPETAALILVANTMMNLDEVVMKN